jgi:hypothetical protein
MLAHTQPPGTHTLYVSKLPYNVTEPALWRLFRAKDAEEVRRAQEGEEAFRDEAGIEAPPPGAVRIPRNATGWGKGFAFVTLGRYSVYLLYWYKSTNTDAGGGSLGSGEQVARALSLDGVVWQGRR